MIRPILCAFLLFTVSGCGIFNPAPAADPVNQPAIDNRTRLLNAYTLHAATVKTVDTLYASGSIPKAAVVSLRNDLATARTLIDAAKDAMVNGDFVSAILKAESALTAVKARATPTKSVPPATAPAVPPASKPATPATAVGVWSV